MAVYERSETYVHRITIRNNQSQATDPSAVSLTITDPCGLVLVNALAMTKESVGNYRYYYNIESTATYGKYSTLMISTVTTGEQTRVQDEFFVMPYKLEKTARRLSGITDTKSISDEDISHIAWMSYKDALKDVYGHHYRETPRGNPDTGVMFNGINTTFQTNFYPIADSDGDGTVAGFDEQSCGTDINGWWIDNTGSYNQASITVSNSNNGEITITQRSGSAIPSNNEGVYLDYWSEYDSYDSYIFEQAVGYLTAHHVMMRMKSVDNVTIADLGRNVPIVLKDEMRFFNEYRRLIKKISEPLMGVA